MQSPFTLQKIFIYYIMILIKNKSLKNLIKIIYIF